MTKYLHGSKTITSLIYRRIQWEGRNKKMESEEGRNGVEKGRSRVKKSKIE